MLTGPLPPFDSQFVLFHLCWLLQPFLRQETNPNLLGFSFHHRSFKDHQFLHRWYCLASLPPRLLLDTTTKTLILPCFPAVISLLLTESEWWSHEMFHIRNSKHMQTCRLRFLRFVIHLWVSVLKLKSAPKSLTKMMQVYTSQQKKKMFATLTWVLRLKFPSPPWLQNLFYHTHTPYELRDCGKGWNHNKIQTW